MSHFPISSSTAKFTPAAVPLDAGKIIAKQHACLPPGMQMTIWGTPIIPESAGEAPFYASAAVSGGNCITSLLSCNLVGTLLWSAATALSVHAINVVHFGAAIEQVHATANTLSDELSATRSEFTRISATASQLEQHNTQLRDVIHGGDAALQARHSAFEKLLTKHAKLEESVVQTTRALEEQQTALRSVSRTVQDKTDQLARITQRLDDRVEDAALRIGSVTGQLETVTAGVVQLSPGRGQPGVNVKQQRTFHTNAGLA